MAKIKATFGSDVSSDTPMPVLEVDGVDLVALGGVVGFKISARSGSQSRCDIEFDFLGHGIDFDGQIRCDGVRFPVEVSEAIVQRIFDRFKSELKSRLVERRRDYEHGGGFTRDQSRIGPAVIDDAIKCVNSELDFLQEDIAKGTI